MKNLRLFLIVLALWLGAGSAAYAQSIAIGGYGTSDCDTYFVNGSFSITPTTPTSVEIVETVGSLQTTVPATLVSLTGFTFRLSYRPSATGPYSLSIRWITNFGTGSIVDTSNAVAVTPCSLSIGFPTYTCPNAVSIALSVDMPRELAPPATVPPPPTPPQFTAANFAINEVPGGFQPAASLTVQGPATGVPGPITGITRRYTYEYYLNYNSPRTANYSASVLFQQAGTTLVSNATGVTVLDCAIQSQLIIRGIGTTDCSNYTVYYDLVRPQNTSVTIRAIRVQVGTNPAVSVVPAVAPGSFGFTLPPGGAAPILIEADVDEAPLTPANNIGFRSGTARATTTAQACRIQLESITRNECTGSTERIVGVRLAITAPTYQSQPAQPPATGADTSIFRLVNFTMFEPELAAPSSRTDFTASPGSAVDTTVYRMTLHYTTRKLNAYNVFVRWNPAANAIYDSGILPVPAIVCFQPQIEIQAPRTNDCGLIAFPVVYIVAPGSGPTVRLRQSNLTLRETPSPNGSGVRDYIPLGDPVFEGFVSTSSNDRQTYLVTYQTANRPSTPTQNYRLQVLIDGQLFAPSILVHPECPLNTSCPVNDGGAFGSTYVGRLGPSNNTYTLASCAADVTPCRLPNGLALSTDGLIQGIANEIGQFGFTVLATRNGFSESRTCRIGIGPKPRPEVPPLTISCPTVAQGRAFEPFQLSANASGGAGDYSFFVASGVLPPGLSIRSDGTIFGVPTEAGMFTIGVRDEDGRVATATCPMVIAPALPVRVVGSCPTGRSVAGLSMASQEFGAAGGSGIFTIRTTGLPEGLSAQGGRISGAPAQPGRYEYSVVATDTRGVSSAPVTCSITVEDFTASQPADAVRSCGSGVFPLNISGSGFVNPIEVFLGTRSLGVFSPNQDRISVSIPADALRSIGSSTVRLQQQGVPKSVSLNLVVAGITGYAPESVIVPPTMTGNLEMTFAGAGFTNATEVRFGTTNLRPSQISADGARMTVAVPFSLLQTPGAVPIADPSSTGCTVPNFVIRGISRLSREQIVAGGPGFALVIEGEGFAPGSDVLFGSTRLPATVVNPQRVEVMIPAPEVLNPRRLAVNVAGVDELLNAKPFVVAGITSVEPGTIQVGRDAVLTISGEGLDPQGPVTAGNLTLTPAGGGSPTGIQVQLTAAQTAPLSGSIEVRATAGGERTNARTVAVTAPDPTPSVSIQPEVLVAGNRFTLVIRLASALPFDLPVTVQGTFAPASGVGNFTAGNLPGFPLALTFPAGRTEVSQELSGITVAGSVTFTATGSSFNVPSPPRNLPALKPVITRSCLEQAGNDTLRLRVEGFSNTRSMSSVRYQFRVRNNQEVEGLSLDASGAQTAFNTHFGTATNDPFSGGQFALTDTIKIDNGTASLIEGVTVTLDNAAPGTPTTVEVAAGSRCN